MVKSKTMPTRIGRAARTLSVRLFRRMQLALYGRHQKQFDCDLSFTEAAIRFPSRNELHTYMHHHLCHLCPSYIREHRSYYAKEMRGFGEDAFHAMWYLLLREFRPKRCLEIGVYRGQVITLWALVSRALGFDCEIHGISPFSQAGDEVSTYPDGIDYLADTLLHHQHFDLKAPTLLRAKSADLESVEHIRGHDWNLIYIDGSHDYSDVLADYVNCHENLSRGGLLVIDDSSLYTDFKPPLFSFAGHPGPSAVVKDFALPKLGFLGGVGHNNVFVNCP